MPSEREAAGCSDGKPNGVTAQALEEAAVLCGFDGGVALAGEGGNLCDVVSGILLGDGDLSLARTAILNVVVEGFEISCGDFGSGAG